MNVTGLWRYSALFVFSIQKSFFFQTVKSFCTSPSVKNRTRPLFCNLYIYIYIYLTIQRSFFEFPRSNFQEEGRERLIEEYLQACTRFSTKLNRISEYESRFIENRFFFFLIFKTTVSDKTSVCTYTPKVHKYNKHSFDVDTELPYLRHGCSCHAQKMFYHGCMWYFREILKANSYFIHTRRNYRYYRYSTHSFDDHGTNDTCFFLMVLRMAKE